MIQRNFFKVSDQDAYLKHLRIRRGVYDIKRYNFIKYSSIKYILHAYSLKSNLSRDNFIYLDDYYYADNNMDIIIFEDDYCSNFRKNVDSIKYNTIRYLLKNSIIHIADEPDTAKINLLYK